MNEYDLDPVERDLAGHIREALCSWLSEATPRRGVLDLATGQVFRRAHRQHTAGFHLSKWGLPALRDAGSTRRFRLRVAGACVIVLLLFLVSLVRIPVVARAFASVPGIGAAYRGLLRNFGLDVAYEAGLVDEIRKAVTCNGVTVEVISAVCDGTRTTVLWTISLEDPSSGESLEEHLGGLHLWPSVDGPWEEDRGNFCYVVDGRRLCCSEFGPVSWIGRLFGAKATLTVEAAPAEEVPFGGYQREEGGQAVYTWKVAFPVQTITGRVETVEIGKTITTENEEITLTELAFAPTQTILRFSVSTRAGDEGHLSRSWEESRLWRLEGCFSLVTSGGELPPLGIHKGDDLRSYEVRFWPTTRRDVTILFREMIAAPAVLELPLREDATVPCRGGSLKITDLEATESVTSFTLRYTGELRLYGVDFELAEASNEGPVPDATYCHVEHLDSKTVRFTVVPAFEPGAATLKVLPYFLEEEATPVWSAG